jgi:hypothetical protein
MNVSEESDGGILPMNHSNKIEQSMAESEEGRPLIKENIHPSSTRPTQSGTRVTGDRGVCGKRVLNRSAVNHPTYEPYALTSARTDLCGGDQR